MKVKMENLNLSEFDQFIVASKLPIYQSGIARQLKNFGKQYTIVNSPEQLNYIQSQLWHFKHCPP